MPKDVSSEPHCCPCATCQEQPDSNVAQQHRGINWLVTTLDEKGRRLLVAFLARQHGPGGVAHLGRVTGLSRTTIRRGLTELDRPAAADGRIRRPGGGRPRLEKKARASWKP
jgi:DNA-binding phage protein